MGTAYPDTSKCGYTVKTEMSRTSVIMEEERIIFLILMITTPFCISKQDYLISVQNATFEEGALDLMLQMKLTPLPVTMLKTTCYHSASQDHDNTFYVIENKNVTRTGDLGKRASHEITKDKDTYIISLIIRNPTDKDKGDYRCKIYLKQRIRPLVAKLRATKLVALNGIHGESTTFVQGAAEAKMTFFMTPNDITLYWIKCFHNETPDPSAHFYTYDHLSDRAISFGRLGTRTSHTTEVSEDKFKFVLFIQRPVIDDAGQYCCQVDASGVKEPRFVWMTMKNEASSTSPARIYQTTTALVEVDTRHSSGGLEQTWWMLHRTIVITVAVSTVIIVVTAVVCYGIGRTGIFKKGKRRNALDTGIPDTSHKPFLR